MSAEFVPAVDRDGDELWLDPHGYFHFWSIEDLDAPKGWRRLGYMQPVETPAFEHSDMCEDGYIHGDKPHLDPAGACHCVCSKCGDDEGFCICPACSGPESHAHRPVTL